MASLQPQLRSLKLSDANRRCRASLLRPGCSSYHREGLVISFLFFCTGGLSPWIRGDYETASHAPPSLALAGRFIYAVPRWARDAVRTRVQPLERSQHRALRRQRQAGCRTCPAGGGNLAACDVGRVHSTGWALQKALDGVVVLPHYRTASSYSKHRRFSFPLFSHSF